MAKLEITLKHSVTGRPRNQKETARTLGFKKTYQTVVLEDSSAVRGMINTISHLVDVKEIND